MKKKIVSMCAVVALATVAVGGATLAYFTDKDQNTNEFTVGDLAIDLYESVSFVDGAGNEKAMTTNDAITLYDPDGVILGQGNDLNPNVEYKSIMPGDKMGKVVTVENEEEYGAYVALAVKQDNYSNFNANIDGYFEPLGEDMQKITNDIFSGDGWNGLSYDKATNGFDIRYYPTNVTVVDQDGSESYVGETGVQLIAVDYTVEQAAGYTSGYDKNMMGKRHGGSYGVEGNYQSVIDGETPGTCRMWVYYLYLPAGSSYTLDLSMTCPAYITTENIAAFAGMTIDVQAAAIQVDGFATAKDAFVELNKTCGFGF